MPYIQSFDIFAQEPDLYTEIGPVFAPTDGNSLSVNPAALSSAEYDGVDFTSSGMSSIFASLSDLESNEPQTLSAPSTATSSANPYDVLSHTSPASQIPGSATTSLSSPAMSQGDETMGRVESSRVEKRRLNTLAARRCRQRRLDRMKGLEAELDSVRRERDELRLLVSRLEGETEALRTLLSRKSK